MSSSSSRSRSRRSSTPPSSTPPSSTPPSSTPPSTRSSTPRSSTPPSTPPSSDEYEEDRQRRYRVSDQGQGEGRRSRSRRKAPPPPPPPDEEEEDYEEEAPQEDVPPPPPPSSVPAQRIEDEDPESKESGGQTQGSTIGNLGTKGIIAIVVGVLILLAVVITLVVVFVTKEKDPDPVPTPAFTGTTSTAPSGGQDKSPNCKIMSEADGSLSTTKMINCPRNREFGVQGDHCNRTYLQVNSTNGSPCLMRFLLVGGGGGNNGNAGAGSGFLNYSEVTVEHGTKLITKAGEQRYPSVLQIGTVMWLGRPGNDAPTDQTPGGKGFSGGGMAGGTGGGRLAAGFAGGTNGGDGEGEQGGEGSKFDLSTVKFKAWQITPAAGGQPENSNGQPRIGSIIFCQL